jgi:hypothetical protein
MAIESFMMRALFRAVLPTYVTSGLSMNAIIGNARTLGISFRRTDMLADIRAYMGWFTNEAKSRTLSSDRIVPPSYMSDVALGRSAKYRVYGEATYLDKFSGEAHTTIISLYDDMARSKGEWEQWLTDSIKEDVSQPGFNLVGVDFKVVEHNTGWTY